MIVPSWAKIVGGTLSAGAVALSLFVTRAEYTANAAQTQAQLSAVQLTVNDILWRVGGPRGETRRLAATVDHPLTNKAWKDALKLAKIPRAQRATIERPMVILFDESRYTMPTEQTRWCGLTWSVYVRDGDVFKRKIFTELFIPLADEKTLYQGLVHEFLHYLLGLEQGRLADEDNVRAIWPYECPAE